MSNNDIIVKRAFALTRRQFMKSAVVGGSMTALLAACAVPADESAGGDTGAAPADGESASMDGGTMVWVGHQEVAGLGPDDTGPTVQAVLIYNIHDPLVIFDEFAEMEMLLAKSIDVSEDGLTYTIALQEGVLFHDGTPMTSADVKYTWDYYRNPDNATSITGDFIGVESIDTPDDNTVVVNMSEVNAALLSNAGETPIVQSAYHAEVGEDVYKTAPIGCGPYKLIEWQSAEFTELGAFDDYWQGRPTIDTIRQDVVPEPSVRMIALQTGDADSATWPLLTEDSIELEGDDNFNVIRTLVNSIKHFPLNTTLPQLAEKEVRQAMMHAIDRQRIIDDLWGGAAQIAHTNLSPKNTFYYNPDTKKYDYDPETAMQMLDDAGWVMGDDDVREKDGLKLSFTCTTLTGDQARRPIAELVQLMLAEVGIDMQLAESPISAILEALRASEMDASLFNWTYGTTPEPDPFVTLHSEGGNNWNSFSNARIDELIEQGTQVVDPALRQPIYYEIQEIWAEEVPCLYLQVDEGLNVFSKRIQPLPESPVAGDEIYLRAEEWDLNG